MILQMSNFTIQKRAGLGEFEAKEIVLPRLPLVKLPAQVTLLNYSVQQLKEIVMAYFEDPPIDTLTVIKALKIIGCSLSDTKLIAAIEMILKEQLQKSGEGVYSLVSLWTSTRFSLYDFLNKITPAFRKTLVHLLFQHFLLASNQREGGVIQHLGTLLGTVDQKELFSELKRRYEGRGSPMKISVQKCMLVRTERQELRQFIVSWAQFCISAKVERLMEFTLEDNRQELEYLIENVPSMSATFISQIKLTITQENIGRLSSSNSKINTVLQAAIKEWINEQNNYWKVVDHSFDAKFTPAASSVLTYGKQLNKDQLQSECISIKLLYSFFEGRYFHFDKGDAFVSGPEKEGWKDVYKSIGHCSSYKMINLIVINKTLAPSWWRTSDPRKLTIANKNLKKMIDSHSDYLQQRQKQGLTANKKIEIAFSVFIIYDKQARKELMLTLQQLIKYLQGDAPGTYREYFAPSKTEVKIKEEVKKEHNIIIQAKIVRVLKREKENKNIEEIAKSSGYSIETVELAMKRLISKNLAEEIDGKYKYEI